MTSLEAFRSDAAIAVVLMKNRGMTAEQAVAEVLRMNGSSFRELAGSGGPG